MMIAYAIMLMVAAQLAYFTLFLVGFSSALAPKRAPLRAS